MTSLSSIVEQEVNRVKPLIVSENVRAGLAAVIGRQGELRVALGMLRDAPLYAHTSYFVMGCGLARQGRHDDARQVLEEFIAQHVDLSGGPGDEVTLHAARASILALLGDSSAAEREYDLAERLVTQDMPFLYNALTRVFVIAEVWSLAKRSVEMVLRSKPSWIVREVMETIAVAYEPSDAIKLSQCPKERYRRMNFLGVLMGRLAQKDILKAEESLVWLAKHARLSRAAKAVAWSALAEQSQNGPTRSKYLENALESYARIPPCADRGIQTSATYALALVLAKTGRLQDALALASYLTPFSDVWGQHVVMEVAAHHAMNDQYLVAQELLQRHAPTNPGYQERYTLDACATLVNRLLGDIPEGILGGIRDRQRRLGY